MAYQSLYRRRRPQTFADMIGQEHITRTLRNALCSERIAHAYLFCGPRGTGKTTAAKILAKAMNCLEYPTAEPCGQCNPCKNIGAGVSIDVIEMDAASNRGIDEIRDLREKSRFASGESRFKVYIIDEAHMLTPEAANAFLKTLEEPPQNVVFILATTDPARLPPTIVSRCQRFDFHLLTIEQIRQRLEQILAEEDWQAEDMAITLMARLADGSLRDALGILEQCSAYGETIISAEYVRSVTGAARIESVGGLIGAMVDNNFDVGLAIIEEIVYGGRDLSLFLRDLTFVLTRLLLTQDGKDRASAAKLHGFEEIVTTYQDQIERPLILNAIELIHEIGSELRNAYFPQYILEVGFVRLLRLVHGAVQPAASLTVSPPVETEKPVERKPAESRELETKATREPVAKSSEEQQQSQHQHQQQQGDPSPSGDSVEQAERLSGAAKSGGEQDIAQLETLWPRILQELKRRQKSTAAWLEPAALVAFEGHLVRLAYAPEYQIHQERVMTDSHRKLVEEVLTLLLKRKIEIKAELSTESQPRREVATPQRKEEESAQRQEKPVVPKKGPSVEDAMKMFGGKIVDSD